jgi:hypothetical protein
MTTVDPTQRFKETLLDDPPAGPPLVGPPEADARVVRAAGDAYRDALASGHAMGIPDCKVALDLDACRGPIENPTLYVKEGDDPCDVSPADVKQRGIGDCFLLASLAAMARTPEGRALIKGAIVENKDAKGDVASYTVTLHDRTASSWFGFRPSTFPEVKITVNARYALGHAEARWDDTGMLNEVWPLVMERAFAEYAGGYAKLTLGSSAQGALEMLMGKKGDSKRMADVTPKDLQEMVDTGRFPVASILALKPPNPYGLSPSHAYTVEGTSTRDGSAFVLLRNPWSASTVFEIPFTEFNRQFAEVAFCPAK